MNKSNDNNQGQAKAYSRQRQDKEQAGQETDILEIEVRQ